MGRRPHALIQEFFDRGPKLDDNSNRYQHTCKRCGEFFPKGRIDSLTSHLLRRCPNLTPPDRTWVYQQLQANAGKPSQSVKRTFAETFQDVDTSDHRDYQPELPPNLQRSQSALETLAEVSGQYSSRGDIIGAALDQHGRPDNIANSVAEAIAEQALLAQLRGHNASNNTGINDGQPTEDSTSHVPPHQGPALPTQQDLHAGLDVDHNTTNVSESPLVQAASAANRQLEHTDTSHAFIDPQFGIPNNPMQQSFNIPIDMGFRGGDTGNTGDLSWTQPPAPNVMSSFGNLSIPQQDPMAGYGVLANSTRQKPRGRFDDVRRKEVSHIRKQGACIRCRMLKKPCSGATPCKTCANVESARIWKGKCIRTRLSEEMPLWSAKVFQTRAQAKLTEAADLLHGEGVACRIRVKLPPRTGHIDLSAWRYEPVVPQSDPATGTADGSSASTVYTLKLKDDKVEEKLSAYARETIESSVESQSGLVKSILAKTHELSKAAAPTQAAETTGDDPPKMSTRSSYNPQDDILNHALELWVLTEMLTTENEAKLFLMPLLDPESSIESAAVARDLAPASTSHELIQAQLPALMEARCSKLSRNVLNELERRLLQRQQTSRFATLLSALVLLSCVERMTGYFHLKANDLPSNDASQDGQALAGASDSPPDQHTTASPSTLWPLGSRFADTLTSLLRMRALPPKTKVSLSGTLESLRDFAPKKGGGDEAGAVEDWLDGLELSAEALKAARGGDAEGGDGWGLRFVAGVLLPER